MIDTTAPGIWISGYRGRVGSALMATAPGPVDGWGLPELDLDVPESGADLVREHRPRLVIHTAAMTAVDQAALEPEAARRRNATAVGVLARACREIGSGFVQISSNEVFVLDKGSHSVRAMWDGHPTLGAGTHIGLHC